jgi:hypothetical protein
LDEVTKHEKQLEKECEDLRIKLTLANTELDETLITNRALTTELSKFRHLSEQYSEQLDASLKEKRKLSGMWPFILYYHIVVVAFLFFVF